MNFDFSACDRCKTCGQPPNKYVLKEGIEEVKIFCCCLEPLVLPKLSTAVEITPC